MIYTYNINPPVTLINKLLNKYLSHLFLLSVWHQSSRNICWHCIFVLYCSSVIKGSVASRDVLTPPNKDQRLDSLPSSPLHLNCPRDTRRLINERHAREETVTRRPHQAVIFSGLFRIPANPFSCFASCVKLIFFSMSCSRISFSSFWDASRI